MDITPSPCPPLLPYCLLPYRTVNGDPALVFSRGGFVAFHLINSGHVIANTVSTEAV